MSAAEQGVIVDMTEDTPALSLVFRRHGEPGRCSLCGNPQEAGVYITSPATSRNFHLICEPCIKSMQLALGAS